MIVNIGFLASLENGQKKILVLNLNILSSLDWIVRLSLLEYFTDVHGDRS